MFSNYQVARPDAVLDEDHRASGERRCIWERAEVPDDLRLLMRPEHLDRDSHYPAKNQPGDIWDLARSSCGDRE